MSKIIHSSRTKIEKPKEHIRKVVFETTFCYLFPLLQMNQFSPYFFFPSQGTILSLKLRERLFNWYGTERWNKFKPIIATFFIELKERPLLGQQVSHQGWIRGVLHARKHARDPPWFWDPEQTHQKSKTWHQWPHKKNLCPPKKF